MSPRKKSLSILLPFPFLMYNLKLSMSLIEDTESLYIRDGLKLFIPPTRQPFVPSGKSNILLKSGELHLGLSKDKAETRAILEKVQELENQGYQFEAAEASFELLMKKELGK